MLVEGSHCQIGSLGDFFDKGFLVPFLTKQGNTGRLQSLAFFQASFLLRQRGKILSRQQIWALVHCGLRLPNHAPIRAAAQHQSINSPNKPAVCGDMLGKTTGKNVLENGSSNSVGSSNVTAPAGQSLSGN